MKTVITSSGDSLSSKLDLRFGRAAWFCILNEETGKTSFVENEQINASHGAGSKAAEKMVELGVSKVISGDFGPRAKEILDKFNIQMVILEDETLTIKEILKKINN
jgi:predicted Fe-Mo cluster-binding NifX family protein